MKKFTLSLLTSLFIGASASVYADNYSDFQNYKAGDSLAWFYNLSEESLSQYNWKQIEGKLLDIIAKEKISDAAFNRACELLKVIGTKKSIAVLSNFIGDDARTAWVCDVFLALDDDDAEDVLAAKLPSLKPQNAMTVISTLAKFGDDDNIDIIAKYTDSQDKELAKFAVCSLAKFVDDDAVEVLAKIAKKADFRANTAYEALSMIAFDAAKAGDKSLAREALEAVPADFSMSIVARSMVAKDKIKYLDSIIIADGKNVAEAGRAIYKSRKYEGSEAIINAFPTLSKNAKLAAMSTFMLSGDTRFYSLIAPLLDSKDSDLKDEAIYAARFICADETSLRKIYPMLTDSRRITKGLVRNVFEENASMAASKILKEKMAEGDMLAFEILVRRGDTEARDKLMKMYLEGGYENSKISTLLENVIVSGELPELANNLKSDNEKLRKDIVKIIIKKLVKTRDDLYMGEAAFEIVNGKLDKSDPLYKFIESKLKTKIRPRKAVWQSEFRNAAVEDSQMKAATESEPDTQKGFVSLFDGKTLNGWKKSVEDAKFEVVDGCIVGQAEQKINQNQYLITERSDFKDFILVCEFKFDYPCNSGVMFRGRIDSKNRVAGPQAEIDNSHKRRWTGGIVEECGPWKYSLSRKDQEDARNAIDVSGWNKMTIKCVGDKMQTWINGVPVADLEWKKVKAGFIALEIRQAKYGKILWRDIKIKEVK